VANFQVVAGANSVTLLLALASLPPLIGGDFDLSVGYILELASVLVAVAGRAGSPERGLRDCPRPS